MTQHLLILGHGYTAAAIAARMIAAGFTVTGTTRSPDRAASIAATGVAPLVLGRDDLSSAAARASHVLCSASPDTQGDPFLPELETTLRAAAPRWIGYLSTTGVYGDHDGGWVDEATPPAPTATRNRWRLKAEAQWQALGGHVFRLAGIYGPGRGPFAKVRAGTARRLVKPGQVFGRIHVDDIAAIVAASIARPNPGAIYNCADDMPAPPQDVIGHAAELLGLPLPPEEDFETADVSDMLRSFYAANRRVANHRIKQELGVSLRFPDYRAGLADILSREAAG